MKEGNKGERREGKKEEPACLSLLFSLGLINTCLSLMLKSSQSPRILTPRLVHLFLGQLKVYYLGYSHLLFPHPLILSHLISKKKTQMAHLRSFEHHHHHPIVLRVKTKILIGSLLSYITLPLYVSLATLPISICSFLKPKSFSISEGFYVLSSLPGILT